MAIIARQNDSTLTRSTSASERDKIETRGRNMVVYTWYPTKEFVTWKASKIWYPGSVITGIPYSQTTNQTNLAAFQSALKKSDFQMNITITAIEHQSTEMTVLVLCLLLLTSVGILRLPL